MNLHGVRALLISFLLIAILTFPVSACTGFAIEKEERILVGLNEDESLHNNFSIRFTNGGSHRYSYVSFCATDNPYSDIRSGMNDQGLVMDSFQIPATPMNETDKPLLNDHHYKRILGRCADISEVIALFDQYTTWSTFNRGFWDYQFLIADRNGDSVVISPGPDGRVAFTVKEGNYQAVTNFNPVMPEIGWYPCSRYNYAINKLHEMNESDEVTLEDCRSILQNVGREGGTAFSVIFDLAALDMWVFYNYEFEECATFNLRKELEIGEYTKPIYTLEMKSFEGTSSIQLQGGGISQIEDGGIIPTVLLVGSITVLGISFIIYYLRRIDREC
ncbi:MAG: hypothetical protein ACXAEF_04040 [Candidatus Thorarchaeota archaeon]|jgi:hypothetical protein